MNANKVIWEGWTIQNFIDELESSVEMIMNGESWKKPFKDKSELKVYLRENQPYYKKDIPEVLAYFCNKYKIK